MKGFKLLSVLSVVFVFVFFCVGTVAFADETSVFDYYKNDDGTVTITGYKANDVNIDIPETVDTYKVTAIGDNAFSQMKRIESVTIPRGVTAIGDEAFYGCTSLITIKIPDTITEIGDYAFGGCSLLKDLTIPETADMVSDNIFEERDDTENSGASLSSGTMSATDNKKETIDYTAVMIMMVLVLIFSVTACGICIGLFIKSKRNKK